MIVHDQVDRSEWIRVQLAVDAARRRSVTVDGSAAAGLHRARSDPSLVSLRSSAADWVHVQSDDDDDDDDDDINWTAVSPELDALCRNSKSAASRRNPQRTHAAGASIRGF